MADLEEIGSILEVAMGSEASRQDRIAALKHLDELAGDKTANLDKDLRHYLQRRSYEKARDYLAAGPKNK